jgi:polyphosphate kinase 2
MAKRKRQKSGQEIPERAHPRLKRKLYEAELEKLQVELVKLQEWVKREGAKIVVVFEGRDAAGKGGVIRRIAERVSPRVFRSVALPAPNERERTQYYFQRYIQHLPAAGEVVLFDRSWYNRAGVERVMGFCTEDEYHEFLRVCPQFEQTIINSGIRLFKYWLTVGEAQQERRFLQRITDPKRQWKLSPIDLEARRRWYDYSLARDDMLAATDTTHAPWYIVDSNDQRRARLNCISHLLDQLPYDHEPRAPVDLPERSTERAYDDVAALAGRRFVPDRY